MMRGGQPKLYSIPPIFSPEDGKTILEPESEGRGSWVGAPSAFFDSESGKFFLYYRYRRPRGLGRGLRACIAQSENPTEGFKQIWEATKEDFNSPSVERASLHKGLNGVWRLYISYVDGSDGRWRVDVMEADSPAHFEPRKRKPVLTPHNIKAEGVKDPFVFTVGGLYYMLLSYAPTPEKIDEETARAMHATADVYNTGITRSATGLAVSNDGRSFQWLGEVFGPNPGHWDAYASRITCVLYRPPIFVAYYDGSVSVEENYEEKTGLAQSWDLLVFQRISTDAPILTSPQSTGSLRYIDALEVEGRLYFYYEYAREDRSHELRSNVVEA